MYKNITEKFYKGRGQTHEPFKIIRGFKYFVSNKPSKKLMVEVNGKRIYFGQTGFMHFRDKTGLLNPDLQHFDEKRRLNYIMRSSNIKDKYGNYTQSDPNSANYHALNILW